MLFNIIIKSDKSSKHSLFCLFSQILKQLFYKPSQTPPIINISLGRRLGWGTSVIHTFYIHVSCLLRAGERKQRLLFVFSVMRSILVKDPLVLCISILFKVLAYSFVEWMTVSKPSLPTSGYPNEPPYQLFWLPRWLSGKESACRCRRCGFHP